MAVIIDYYANLTRSINTQFIPQSSQSARSLHYITLHYITLHYITLQYLGIKQLALYILYIYTRAYIKMQLALLEKELKLRKVKKLTFKSTMKKPCTTCR